MTFPHNPARAARRTTEAIEELETDQARCVYCGNTDPLLVKSRRFQDHHLFGKDRDEATVMACLNCHEGATEGLRDAEVPMSCEKEPTLFARAIFRALAVHFTLLAKACWRFAKKMEE